MRFNSWIKQFLPTGIQEQVRNSTWWTHYQARKLARGSRRLDLCASQFAQLLLFSQIPTLEGKVCLELGSGWVLSHALAMHLLGASKVIATDLAPIAQPRFLRDAVKAAIGSFVRDALTPFCPPGEVRRRWQRLQELQDWNLDSLGKLGIEYVAPFDFARQPYPLPVDFVFSNSVLEHIFVRQTKVTLNNLASSLAPGGEMYHSFHLEDHRNFEQRPFDFLAEPAKDYGETEQADRGNRIRFSNWRRLFQELPAIKTTVVHHWERLDVPLPSHIDPSIEYEDESDLRTSHLCFLSRKSRDQVV